METTLLPIEELDADQLLAAYDWPTDGPGGRWVRAMMVTTLDGAAAGPDGLSGSISSAADKAVFDSVRRLADVVLVGAGTLRAEQYGPMTAKPADAERRAADGQAAAPLLAVVSGSLELDWSMPVFSASTLRPLVISGASPDPERLAAARAHVEVALTSDDEASAAAILDVLDRRGLRRVVCEGGPTLLAAMVAADLVDEADITLSPTFAGTGHTPQTDSLAVPARFALRHVLAGDDFLMTRYVRPAAPDGDAR